MEKNLKTAIIVKTTKTAKILETAKLSGMFFVFVQMIVFIFSSTLHAKELPNRLGLGIKNNTSFDLPAIAIIYYPNRDVGITGGLGMDTKKDESKFNFDIGARRILFREDNLNFFYGGQLGFVNQEIAGDKQSGFELDALFGAEFFFAGLENLGFNFEGGVGVSSLKNTRFRTIGDSPVRAGIVFYF